MHLACACPNHVRKHNRDLPGSPQPRFPAHYNIFFVIRHPPPTAHFSVQARADAPAHSSSTLEQGFDAAAEATRPGPATSTTSYESVVADVALATTKWGSTEAPEATPATTLTPTGSPSTASGPGEVQVQAHEQEQEHVVVDDTSSRVILQNEPRLTVGVAAARGSGDGGSSNTNGGGGGDGGSISSSRSSGGGGADVGSGRPSARSVTFTIEYKVIRMDHDSSLIGAKGLEKYTGTVDKEGKFTGNGSGLVQVGAVDVYQILGNTGATTAHKVGADWHLTFLDPVVGGTASAVLRPEGEGFSGVYYTETYKANKATMNYSMLLGNKNELTVAAGGVEVEGPAASGSKHGPWEPDGEGTATPKHHSTAGEGGGAAAATKPATQARVKQPRNDQGNLVAFGNDTKNPRSQGSHKYYCGKRPAEGLTGSDGR